ADHLDPRSMRNLIVIVDTKIVVGQIRHGRRYSLKFFNSSTSAPNARLSFSTTRTTIGSTAGIARGQSFRPRLCLRHRETNHNLFRNRLLAEYYLFIPDPTWSFHEAAAGPVCCSLIDSLFRPNTFEFACRKRLGRGRRGMWGAGTR